MDARHLAAIKRFEGFSSRATWDYGQYSNGFGTKARFPGEVVDVKQAEARFEAEIAKAEAAVEAFAPHVDEGMKAALTSLTYNAGAGWMKSGLGSAVESGDAQAIGHLFAQYNKAGGTTLQGLVNRRLEELSWLAPYGPAAVASPEGAGVPGELAASGDVTVVDIAERSLSQPAVSPAMTRTEPQLGETHDAFSEVRPAVSTLQQIHSEYWRLLAASTSVSSLIGTSDRDRSA